MLRMFRVVSKGTLTVPLKPSERDPDGPFETLRCSEWVGCESSGGFRVDRQGPFRSPHHTSNKNSNAAMTTTHPTTVTGSDTPMGPSPRAEGPSSRDKGTCKVPFVTPSDTATPTSILGKRTRDGDASSSPAKRARAALDKAKERMEQARSEATDAKVKADEAKVKADEASEKARLASRAVLVATHLDKVEQDFAEYKTPFRPYTGTPAVGNLLESNQIMKSYYVVTNILDTGCIVHRVAVETNLRSNREEADLFRASCGGQIALDKDFKGKASIGTLSPYQGDVAPWRKPVVWKTF